MSFIIKTDGSMMACEPKSKKMGFTGDELYASLNCEMVQVILVREGSTEVKNPILICHEQALFAHKQLNAVASLLAGTDIVGDVILTESNNLK